MPGSDSFDHRVSHLRPLTIMAYAHVIPNGTYFFERRGEQRIPLKELLGDAYGYGVLWWHAPPQPLGALGP